MRGRSRAGGNACPTTAVQALAKPGGAGVSACPNSFTASHGRGSASRIDTRLPSRDRKRAVLQRTTTVSARIFNASQVAHAARPVIVHRLPQLAFRVHHE